MLDTFHLRTRLQPALIALAPLGLAIIGCTAINSPVLGIIYSGMGTTGMSFLLAMWVRQRGRQIEGHLFERWGGKPTTQLLRHSGQANEHLRKGWHIGLEKLQGRQLPTKAEEEAEPMAADAVYDSAIIMLIDSTRDKVKFARVYNELINYNFCRNLFAIRGIGLAASIVGAVTSCVAAISFGGAVAWVVTAACLMICCIWWKMVSSEFARVPAFEYANHLLRSIDHITPSKSPTRTKAISKKDDEKKQRSPNQEKKI